MLTTKQEARRQQDQDKFVSVIQKHYQNVNFSDMIYLGNKIKLKLSCLLHPEAGVVEKHPASFKDKRYIGKPFCSICNQIENKDKEDKESFIDKLEKQFGSSFDFSSLTIDENTTATFKCFKHPEVIIKGKTKHLKGSPLHPCKFCRNNNKHLTKICQGANLCGNKECAFCLAESFASVQFVDTFICLQNMFDMRGPNLIRLTATDTCYFRCLKCHIVYDTQPRYFEDVDLKHKKNIAKCTHCNGKKLCESADCSVCFKFSFAASKFIEYFMGWVDKSFTKTPRQVLLNTKIDGIFHCITCKHTVDVLLSAVQQKNKIPCVYCNSLARCSNKDCVSCLKNSFASQNQIILDMWSTSNVLQPWQVPKSSNQQILFNCASCKHRDISLNVSNVTAKIIELKKSNQQLSLCCGYCHTELCSDDSCDYCFRKSFASHPMAIYWHDSNLMTSRNVASKSDQICDFMCPYCSQIWSSTLANITSNGQWCPCRNKKTETILFEFLTKLFDQNEIEQQFPIKISPSDLIHKKMDFYLPGKNIFVELDVCFCAYIHE